MAKSLGALEVKCQGTTKTLDDYVTYVPHIWFYVFMCNSGGYKVIKWVTMMYIVSVSSFVKFGRETSKNVHDIRKFFLEMIYCL